jgi:hypothetical protein
VDFVGKRGSGCFNDRADEPEAFGGRVCSLGQINQCPNRPAPSRLINLLAENLAVNVVRVREVHWEDDRRLHRG